MRTHEFEFKKTVKRTQKFKAISIDLTVAEAEVLHGFCISGSEETTDWDPEHTNPANVAISELLCALGAFLYKNPEHLRLGTHAENVADKIAKGRKPVQSYKVGGRRWKKDNNV
jgi:hypothetical protein